MRDSVKPVSSIRNPSPSLTIQKTEAGLYDQGYTYNQAGFTYNEAGVAYGGIYGHDIYPLIAMIRTLYPSLTFRDQEGYHSPSRALPIGLLLVLTYSE